MPASRPRAAAERSLIEQVRAFWPGYLWHHRRPWTRRLHHFGSWLCIAGAVAAMALRQPAALALGLAGGYLCAFTGHWVVERNRPLSFGRPVLAGICNWIMFWIELRGGLEHHLRSVEAAEPREPADCGSC